MKNKIIQLFILLLTAIVFGQTNFFPYEDFTSYAGYLKEQKIVTENINGIEYEVYLKNGNQVLPKIKTISGTCFFIYTDFDAYLVTASHVAVNLSANTILMVENRNDLKASEHKLLDITSLKNGKLNWTFNREADVAVLLLDSSKLDLIEPEKAITVYDFYRLEFELKAPARSSKLTVMGFPLSLGIGGNNISAISKTSSPSSGLLTLPRFDNGIRTNFFLLDDPSVSGFSGSPLFSPLLVLANNKHSFDKSFNILGLVHGSISKNGGGFTAIVPSFYIKETIEDAPGFSGTYDFKYENGKHWSTVIYKNGVPYTVINNYNSNGILVEKGTLNQGNGTLYRYDENGNLKKVLYYNGGHIKKIEYKK